jgi:hypothetical protein
MLSMVTEVMVIAVLGTITVAPISSPKDWLTALTNMTEAQLAKKAPGVRRSPDMKYILQYKQRTSFHCRRHDRHTTIDRHAKYTLAQANGYTDTAVF